MKNIDWSKAPEGTTHYVLSREAAVPSGWYQADGNKMRNIFLDGEYTFRLDDVHPGQLLDLFERPSAWTGEGLPPVGTVCEWHPNHDGWVQVEILGHSGEETWFRREGHESSETCLRMTFFRPIRTPEQIAEEARENELNRMVATVSMLDKGWARKVCAGLYDAGYRKQDNAEGGEDDYQDL